MHIHKYPIDAKNVGNALYWFSNKTTMDLFIGYIQGCIFMTTFVSSMGQIYF